jgi:hypothetical protein
MIVMMPQYVFTFPAIKISGFLWGKFILEWVDDVTITCKKTGLTCLVDYHAKPWFRGKYHCVSGKVWRGDEKKKPLRTFSGRWTEKMTVVNPQTNTEKLMFDASKTPLTMMVRALEKQDDFESRKVWADVTAGILAKDYKKANAAKKAVEEAQRARIKQMKANGQEYTGKNFKAEVVDEEGIIDWKYKRLDSLLAKATKSHHHKHDNE